METITDLVDDIEQLRMDASGDLDVWAGEQLAQLRTEMLRLKQDDAYQRYLRRHVLEYDPEENEDKPKCTCGNDCPVINNRIPAQVRRADDVSTAVDQYAIRHPGQPHALLTAEKRYRQAIAELYTSLERIRRHLRAGELPENTEGTRAVVSDAR